MAEQTRKHGGESKTFDLKMQHLLMQYSSTVFACDISGDTRYIRCDFPQCRQHAESLQGKRCWLLNTLKNVKYLESHVSKEIHHYMKEKDAEVNQCTNAAKMLSEQLLATQQLHKGIRKVLAVFNLKDPQSQFGDWISLFLKAASMAEERKEDDYVVISQDFVSRYELMECIAKLGFLNSCSPTVDVVVVLSCHSSCQGQVFSCTPTAIGKQSVFEEFCSLHDFVMACQTVLKERLTAVHISSCFTLKLDCSHVDWPVDANWLKSRLRCTLCGSTKEVYETGSQVADLYLMLSTLLSSGTAGTCGALFRAVVQRACAEEFPDLAREMGLEVVHPNAIDDRLLSACQEDQVTPPGLVVSCVRVVLLVQDESFNGLTDLQDDASHAGPYVAVANALEANLKMRKASDVKCNFVVLRIGQDKTCFANTSASIRRSLDRLPHDNLKVLFVAIGPMFSNPNVQLIECVQDWSNGSGNKGGACYGLHFQHVTAMQAYFIKSMLKKTLGSTARTGFIHDGASKQRRAHLAVTGLVDNSNGNSASSFPVLLYMIHLAVGENGNRLAGKGIPSAVYSKKPVAHGLSRWSWEEVYLETCHVLLGLSRKCGLCLLSPTLRSDPSLMSSSRDTANSERCSENEQSVECIQGRDLHASGSASDEGPIVASKGKPTGDSAASSDVSSSVSNTTVRVDAQRWCKETYKDEAHIASCSRREIIAPMKESTDAPESNSDTNPGTEWTPKHAVTVELGKKSDSHVSSLSCVDIPTPDSSNSSTLRTIAATTIASDPGLTAKQENTVELVKERNENVLPSSCNKTPVKCHSDGSPNLFPETQFPSTDVLTFKDMTTPKEGNGAQIFQETDTVASTVGCDGIPAVSNDVPVDLESVLSRSSNPFFLAPEYVGTPQTIVDTSEMVGREDVEALSGVVKNAPVTPRVPGSGVNLNLNLTMNESTETCSHSVGEQAKTESFLYETSLHLQPNRGSHKSDNGASFCELNVDTSVVSQGGNLLRGTMAPAADGSSDPLGSGGKNLLAECLPRVYESVPSSSRSKAVSSDSGIFSQGGSAMDTNKAVGCHSPDSALKGVRGTHQENVEYGERCQELVPADASTSCSGLASSTFSAVREGGDPPKKLSELQRWAINFVDFCSKPRLSSGRKPKERHQKPTKHLNGRRVPFENHAVSDCNDGTLYVSENSQSNNKIPGAMKGKGSCQTNVDPRFEKETVESVRSGTDSVPKTNCVEQRIEELTCQRNLEIGEKNINVEIASVDNTLEGTEIEIEYEVDNNVDRKRPVALEGSARKFPHVPAKLPRLEAPEEDQSRTVVGECPERKSWDSSNDLPLMANVDEVLVTHYILDLRVEFNEKIMKGSIVVFLEPCNDEVRKKQFQMTLDSTLVNIESVSEVIIPGDFKVRPFTDQGASLSWQRCTGFLENFLGNKAQNPLPYKGLNYSVYGWCVRIWKPGAKEQSWPKCVWIRYHTSPEGKSLTWATDQDGRPSVYSPGAYINNRSLMPCQEPTVALSTWQASIHVPEGCMVLMSGNRLAGQTATRDGLVTYHYEMDTPLPCSTLALAAGWWQCRQSRDANSPASASVSCRLFATPSLLDRAAEELLDYAPKFLEAACQLLGPYPFRRLDVLILPRCFACMGLKSPNLVFLSQSLLSGDGSMRVRLAHEISHAWFGLLLGAKDWSEEWLSEGFATFVEEKIQSVAEEWSDDKDRYFRELRQILRHRCLLAEIQECDDNLKCLRPQKVKPSTAVSAAEAVRKSPGQSDAVRPHSVVQFGQMCSRKWTQVHYLKGYFLLHHMANMVGLDAFYHFLHNYVQHYKGQLVTSEDFFEFFVQCFSNIPRDAKERFNREWLESPQMPKSFPKRFDSPENELVSQVEEEFLTWKKHDAVIKRNTTLRSRKRKKPPICKLVFPEQVVLLLEKLLERETITHSTLRQLDKCYSLSSGNAEIRHRWCELIVKHKFHQALTEVKRFLVEDQGMGIYLFGELIISQQPKQRGLVDEVLEEIGSEMDRCTYQTVKDMLDGND